MIRRIVATAVVAMGMMTGIALAQDNPVVVELYTSQGCSSCPPADAMLADLAKRDDVIALALHVDYWDYIGWKDEFASPAFTTRQRGYAHAAGTRRIYTPQMVVAGKDHVIGAKPMKLSELLMRHARTPAKVDLRLGRDGDRVVIRAAANGSLPRGAVVQIATYTPEATVAIKRGENAGRTLTYHNIVRSLREVGTWDGRSDYSVSVRVPSDLPVVVLIQEPGRGPMLGAARLR